MVMPPNQTPQNSLWWSNWFFTHGKDTQHEAAFVGYLSTQGLHPFALSPEQLGTQWVNFQGYMAASEAEI